MYFSSNENYMQDLYTYNQNPINTYNPYFVNSPGMNQMGFGINPNNNMFPNPNMNNQNVNPNSLFPSVYRIINPVVNRVVSSTNTSYLTEDILNNMTDTVYNIVEGQIESDDFINQNQATLNQNLNSDSISRTANNSNGNISNTNLNSSNTTNNSSTSRSSNDMVSRSNSNSASNNSNFNISNQNTSTGSRRYHSHDMLLKDLIKILILKQILSRGNNHKNPYLFNYQNQFMPNQNYMNPNNFGFYS